MKSSGRAKIGRLAVENDFSSGAITKAGMLSHSDDRPAARIVEDFEQGMHSLVGGLDPCNQVSMAAMIALPYEWLGGFQSATGLSY